MNGFAIYGGDIRELCADPGRVLPPDGKTTSDRQRIGRCESILTWGVANGDVHWAARGQDSFVVVSGYLTGTSSGTTFRDQNAAAEWCLAKIATDDSVAGLSRWLHELRGSFALFYRNAATDITLCISDRVASRPLWREWLQSGWIVSSHPVMIALSVRARRFDPTAVGSFLLYGGAVEPTRSLFDGIEGTPAGTIVSLRSNGACEQSQWYVFRHEPDDHEDHQKNHKRSNDSWIHVLPACLLRAIITARSGACG